MDQYIDSCTEGKIDIRKKNRGGVREEDKEIEQNQIIKIGFINANGIPTGMKNLHKY